MIERFTIAHGKPGAKRYWTNVVIYDTSEQMRRAAQLHRPQSVVAEDSGGCFQAGNSGHPRYVGIIRLSREYLNPSAVVHESVHAALAYVQKARNVDRLHLDAWSDGQRIIDNEEELAYAVHGIATALLNELGLTTCTA